MAPRKRPVPSPQMPRRAQTRRLNPTRNDLSQSARSGASERLNQLLADSIDLQSQCKQAHWNVKGPAFMSLHKLFDEIHGAVSEYVDLIAERLVQLGGTAAGTVRSVAVRTTLPDYPPTVTSGRAHVTALAGSLASFGRTARRGIEEMTALEDAVSADMLTEVTRGIDQWLWFVEAHLQGK